MGSAERELLPKGMRYALGLRLVLVGASSLFSLFLVSAPNQAVTTAVVLGFNLWSVWFASRLVRATGRGRHWLVAADIAVLCGVLFAGCAFIVAGTVLLLV